MILWLLGPGCPGAPKDDTGCEMSVEVGNGEDTHVPFGEGAVMVHGPQGGWHIWLSASAQCFDEVVMLEVTMEDQTLGEMMTDDPLSFYIALVYEDDDPDRGDIWGLFGLLPLDDTTTTEIETPPAYRACHTFEICLEASDDSGHLATHCATTTAWVDEQDREDPEDPCSYAEPE